MVKTISAAKESPVETGNDPVIGVNLKLWSTEELCAAQMADSDISYIMNLKQNYMERPCWEAPTDQTYDFRVLWETWSRLKVWNGILYKQFDSSDGLATTWQVILPKQLRQEFLYKMINGHLSCKRTAASIQSMAYWPTWSSDLNTLWKKRRSDEFSCRGLVPGETAQNTTSKPFLDHEDRRSIDVVMGSSPGQKNAATSPHDILREDVTNACRIGRERLRASAARSEEVDVLKKKMDQFGVGGYGDCQPGEQWKKCFELTPVSRVSAGAQ